MYRSREDYSLVYFLLIVLVITLVILLGALIHQASVTSKFDSAFQEEKIVLEANKISIGESGHPALTEYSGDIPTLRELGESPRLDWVSGCKGYEVISDYQAVMVSTRFSSPELISVQMPQESNGYMNICAPKGSKVEIILWLVR